MYKIYFNGQPIYDPRGQTRGLIIRDPDCHLAVGEAGSLAFNIDDDHPNAKALTKLAGVLELRDGAVTIFKGRIVKDTREFDLTRRIEAEGLLACLNDSVLPPFKYPEDFLEDAAYQLAAESGNVIEFFLDWILAQHNSQVGANGSTAQQIQLGEVTVSDPNNYISRASSEYLTSMEVVHNKLVDLLGGYLLIDYNTSPPTLNYYADLPLTNMQAVEYGENLLDLVTETDATKVYTAILPIGKDGLTIGAADPDGVGPDYRVRGNIIYNPALEEQLGGLRIIRKVVWDDVTVADNLQKKAVAELAGDGILLAQTISVKAADLGGTDDLPRFKVGRYVELKSSPHGFSAAYPLMELEPNILDPGDTTITLGATVRAASDLANKNQSANQEKADQQYIDLTGKLVSELKNHSLEVKKTSESFTITALGSYVTQTEHGEYKREVSNTFQQTDEATRLKFEETNTAITNVDGDLKQTKTSLNKHFDFTLEKGLLIRSGVDENTGTAVAALRLDSGVIQFERNNRPGGWWDGEDFHTGNLWIELNERARIGNFAFVPRSNGSLDFLKVGG